MNGFMIYLRILLTCGSFVSIMCLILLMSAWYLMPQWRSLQNYISVNQVLFGTLHLCWSATCYEFSLDKSHPRISYKTSIALFVLTICWSLNATMLAYLRLVLVFSGKISYEKRKVTVSTFIMAAIVLGWLEVSCNIHGKAMCFAISNMYVGLIMTVSMVIFGKIVFSVMSCCKKRIAVRRFRHVTALVGVAVLCDTFTICYYFSQAFLNNLDVFYYVLFLDSLFAFRLIPKTIVILLNRSSREHWKAFWRRRNRLLLAERF